ncbi:hypothetical protein EYC84_006653 [Monilinia fructicola]|uniref:Dynamin-binding protein n=1 Tax=Monilinia fructicola TaxID=38448 RepID=A0A5M9K8I7_MONFR|nr:hypothetical protein EYC84_006653 [Monilinia fructicola]
MPRKPMVRTNDGALKSSGNVRDRSNPYTPRVASNPGPTTTTPKTTNNISSKLEIEAPPPVPEKRPLFGELLTLNQGASEAGYGISTSTRRTSESGLPPIISTQQRSRTDADISPTSPTAWYLGVTPSLGDLELNKPRRSGHNRAHSDFADTKTLPLISKSRMQIFTMDPATHTEFHSEPEQQPAKLSSRLPVALKRSGNQSDVSSSPSTRANSPLTGKRVANGKLPRDSRPWTPATRPVGTSSRPTPPGGRIKARSPEKPSSNGSLKAYISAPPARNSPPLRSSRPRQPVSAASTASSRRKAVDGTGGTPETKGRKMMNTEPVNYAARRAQITRAYTKSIHESELQKMRAANARRLSEQSILATNIGERSSSSDRVPALPFSGPEPLQILTNFESQTSPPPVERQVEVDQDSPTLGVTNTVPGAFVDEDVPISAISNVSATTFIENEAQTEAARLARIPSTKLSGSVAVLSQVPEAHDTAFVEQVGSVTESLGMSLESTPIEATPGEVASTEGCGGIMPEESIGNDMTPEAIPENLSKNKAYDEIVTIPVAEPPSPKTLIPKTLDSNSPDHLGLYDESSQQLAEISIKIEQEPDESHLPLESNTYSGEVPRLELPALRTALAESLSPSENDRQLESYTPTDMDYESFEDIGAGHTGNTSEQEDLYGPSYDHNRELYLTSDTYRRGSRNSAWTDFSVATTDDPASQDENQKWINTKTPPPEPEKGPTPPPKVPVPADDLTNPPRPELPPLTSHNGFGLGFDPDTIYSVPTVPVWTSLTPPPGSEKLSRQDAIAKLGYLYSTPKIPQLPLTEEEQAVAKKRSTRLFTRRKIIEEIIDTEAAYLKDMNVVEEIYKGTAEACPKLDFGDIKTIFRNTNEIIAFSTAFLDDLKKAGAAVYTSKARARQSRATASTSTTTTAANTPASLGPNDSCSDPPEFNDFNEEKDRKTFIGHTFGQHLRKMQEVYTEFLKNSELAADRLKILSADPAVDVWLIECNNVAKDLTAAWDLDALLVKPVQRVTRYQLLLDNLVKYTAEDHPDFNALTIASRELLNLLKNIDKLKERIQVVGKIVGRKRKESEVRLGLAKAFGRRSEKLTSNVVRPHDDETFIKLHEKFGHDYLRLQVVMRDVEYYTRQVATWVNDFLRFLSAMELNMRHSPSRHPEMEARWSQFNQSMRDMGSVALEEHVGNIRKTVIEPIENVIREYTKPTDFMKKRSKRRVDYEKWMAANSNGKKVDEKLQASAKEYDALNETLKTELPQLSAKTAEMGQLVLARLIFIQTSWYYIWQEKIKSVLDANKIPMSNLVSSNGTLEVDCFLDRLESTPLASLKDSDSVKTKGRLSDSSARPQGLSLATPHDTSPSLPTPDFAKRHSGQFSFSPILANGPGLPAHAPYQPAAYSNGHSRPGSGHQHHVALHPTMVAFQGLVRILGIVGESSSTQASASYMVDGPLRDQRPFSGIFHSAMPLPDGPEDSARSSRASSMDRAHGSRYNVIYLAASLFEFNIAATKNRSRLPLSNLLCRRNLLMSLEKKASSGWPRTKMMALIKLAGSGPMVFLDSSSGSGGFSIDLELNTCAHFRKSLHAGKQPLCGLLAQIGQGLRFMIDYMT